MIIDRQESHFIFIFSKKHVNKKYNYIRFKGKSLTNKEYLEHWGKWVIFGTKDELDILAKKLSPLVDAHKIPAIKYDREKIAAFELGECVMCVYCDERQKKDVLKLLKSLDVEDEVWVFERETMERWLPGGHLLEKWIQGHSLTKEQADNIREESKLKFKKMFEDDNAIFKGIEQ